MPPLPVINGVQRVAAIWTTAAGQYSTNVMHFQKVGGTSLDLGNKLNARWVQDMNDMISNVYTLSSFDITPLDGGSVTTTVATGGSAAFIGGQTGNVVPASTGIIKLQTALRGRSYRGRLFLGPSAEGNIDNGQQGAGIIGTVGPAWNTFRANMLADLWQMVVASYTLGTASPVTNIVAEQGVATMRRRQTRIRDGLGL